MVTRRLDLDLESPLLAGSPAGPAIPLRSTLILVLSEICNTSVPRSSSMAVMPVPPFTWCDLGTPERVALAMGRRAVFVSGFLLFVIASFALAPFLGRDFFPSVDAGQILMHARIRVGTRVTETRKVPGGNRSMTYEITEHDPPRQSSFQVLDGPIRAIGTVSVDVSEKLSRMLRRARCPARLRPVFLPLRGRRRQRHCPARSRGHAISSRIIAGNFSRHF